MEIKVTSTGKTLSRLTTVVNLKIKIKKNHVSQKKIKMKRRHRITKKKLKKNRKQSKMKKK
jgi:hypothetical protein